MTSPKYIQSQLRSITSHFIEHSLCNDQNFPSLRKLNNGITEVGFSQAGDLSIVLKDRPYTEIYYEMMKGRLFSFKMVDGALIQMMYQFQQGEILSHRLAFFPSPDLEEYQNNPEIYLEDSIYADIVAKSLVPFPVRFDFDDNPGLAQPITHPRSHLTLGQYKNCRIPVSAALMPKQFLYFVLRNFYNTAFVQYFEQTQEPNERFPSSLFEPEKHITHLVV